MEYFIGFILGALFMLGLVLSFLTFTARASDDDDCNLGDC